MEQLNKAIENSKEGKVAVYGNQALYKVNPVMIVPSVARPASDKNNGRSSRHYPKREGNKGFGEIFEAVVTKDNDNIDYKVNGYTKDALAFYTIYQTRDYHL